MKRRDFLTGVAALGAAALVPSAVRALGGERLTEAHRWRRVEVCRQGVWTDTRWPHLCQWDIFRMFEPDTGELVDAGTDHEISIIVRPPEWVGGDEEWKLTTMPFTIVTAGHPLGEWLRVVADGQQVGLVESVDMRRGTMIRKPIPWGPGVEVTSSEPFDYVEYIHLRDDRNRHGIK